MPRGLLDWILEPGALRADFQPVFDLSSAALATHYAEGLVRGPRGSNVERPDVLFGYARRKHAECAVDRAALHAVLRAARELPGDLTIGVNVHVATLSTDLDFVCFLGDVLTETGIAPERVVLELVEHGQPWDLRALHLNLAGIRGIGARVALDDFGTGLANEFMLLECRPDYVKLPGYFVNGCHRDACRRAVLDAVVALTTRVGGRTVAEGIEDALDLAAVRDSGIELGQGFVLARPGPAASFGHRRCA